MALVRTCASLVLVLVQCVCAKYSISLNDAIFARFSPETFNGTWISDTAYIYQLSDTSEIVTYNVVTNVTSTLVNKTLADKFNISISSETEVTVSADGEWIAIEYDDQSVFRHSVSALYIFYELSTGYYFPLAGGERVQLVEWSPVGNSFAFVMKNDVFYQKQHKPPQFHRITNFPDVIYNGVADWVYEEEVLEDTRALWFSPGGTGLVFSSMNDTDVRNVTIWKYGNPGDLQSQYVEEFVVKYPKVGTKNPNVTLNYVDLRQSNITYVTIHTPIDLVTKENILGEVTWADEDHFSPTWMNRLQTLAYTLVCATSDLTCNVLHKYQENNGWLDLAKPVFVNATAFLTILPQDQGGSAGNFRQLCLVTRDLVVPLTKGLDEVTDILAYDKRSGLVYYESTEGQNSAHKHVYAVSYNGSGTADCITCTQGCNYGSAMFSKNASYFIRSCFGPGLPTFQLLNKNGTLISVLGDNEELREMLDNVNLPVKKDIDVAVGNGFTAKVRLLLPAEEKYLGNAKLPLLFNVYSGPGSNKITDRFSTPSWDEYLVTSRNIIIAYLDARGSGLRGDKLKFEIYHKMGGPEIEDIITVAKYLQNKLSYIDPRRTAVWGWSYGGFAAASVLSRDNYDTFRCGISVAPVTNWIYYDTVYTERYMGLPTNDSNLAGYIRSDVSANVENFRRKMFYLIHGNADDNVHYQQSMMLSRALELKDILFYQQSYPDETHSLLHVRRHLYLSMDKFWSKCFKLPHTSCSSNSSNGSEST